MTTNCVSFRTAILVLDTKGFANIWCTYDQNSKWIANLKPASSTLRKNIFSSYPDPVFAYLRCL